MPKKTKPVLPSWYISTLKKEAVMPKHTTHKAGKVEKTKDVNYTIPGLVALFGIVLFTALYFAQGVAVRSSSSNIAGNAFDIIDTAAPAPSSCEIQSRCEGSKLVRQQGDCRQFTAFCQSGCEERPDGAVCL